MWTLGAEAHGRGSGGAKVEGGAVLDGPVEVGLGGGLIGSGV